ncbi:unnamed protein product [Urochloa decumbens]|uniref:B box-type domain-containing protein n=1 Tax=Urochloa decumbens TaxID=240449 RepID=A0ABC9DJ09_9POAL
MGRDESGVGTTPGAGCRRCELCGAPAAVHCAADAAFLCAACDAKVHGANFLASRHRRTRLPLALPAAEADEEEGYASAASSSCVSTADSASTTAAGGARRRRGGRAHAGTGRQPRRATAAAAARAEAVLEGWAKRMGLAPGAARRRAAAAWRALRACGAEAAAARVPPRVAMAAALWWEVAAAGGGSNGGGSTGDALRRLEACAHVPARLVVAVATSLVARARARRRGDAVVEEGWDECAWAGEPKSSPARS